MIKKLKPIGNVLLGIVAILAMSTALGFIASILCKTFVYGWEIVF